jgi:hypothetical protein
MPLGVDSFTNPIVQSYTFLLPLLAEESFYAFQVSSGTIDCNAFPLDATSFLGISVKLITPIAPVP